MKFFVNEGDFTDRLRKYLESKNCQLYLVQAEYQRPDRDDDFADFEGLGVALSLPDDLPLLFCSFMPEVYFIKEEALATKFFALMARKKTGFIDSISYPEEFYNKYLELVDSEKGVDLLAIELEKDQREQEVLGRIKHVIGYLSSEDHGYKEKLAQAIIQAREAGLDGDDQEIIEKIMNFQYGAIEGKFAGKYFPGVFCDLEGTLFLADKINTQLLEELKTLSLSKPITLWTAGNLKDYQAKLIANGIFWKLVSKRNFVGAEVETAYDDYSYDRFQNEFEIKVRNFNPVTSYNQEMELKLQFLHSLLMPAEIPTVLQDSKFSSILNSQIESKTIYAYVEEMKKQEREVYNQTLVVLRDFLLD